MSIIWQRAIDAANLTDIYERVLEGTRLSFNDGMRLHRAVTHHCRLLRPSGAQTQNDKGAHRVLDALLYRFGKLTLADFMRAASVQMTGVRVRKIVPFERGFIEREQD